MLARRPTPAGRWPSAGWRAKAPLRARRRSGARGARRSGNAPTKACPPTGSTAIDQINESPPTVPSSPSSAARVRATASPCAARDPRWLKARREAIDLRDPREENPAQARSMLWRDRALQRRATHGDRHRGRARARLLEPRARGIQGDLRRRRPRTVPATRCVEQLVLFTDPGENADKEMALVLARALSDMQLIELRGVIVSTAPAYDRAKARARHARRARPAPSACRRRHRGHAATARRRAGAALRKARATLRSAPASFLKG